MQMKLLARTPEPFHRGNNVAWNSALNENYFKSLQWSADGTCLVTNSADNHVRTFIVPVDLLEERSEPHVLSPYCSIPSLEPVNAVVSYPGFNLRDSASCLILSSVREHPIRFHSATTSELVASYPLIHTTTEAYITPHTLAFVVDGTRFIAGSESLISIFDVSRTGQEPLHSLLTGPKNRKATWFNPSIHMRGIISALAVEPTSNVLAAGTFGRSIGLYDAAGQGECLGVFTVEGTAADKRIGGRGVTQVMWSPCGRYLYIAERKSDGVVVYDIRKTGQLLSWTEGRNAITNQRLGIDIHAFSAEASGAAGHEIWAGGTDGKIRVWKNVHQSEGAVQSALEREAHDDPVTGVAVHRTGGIVATTSGQRHYDFHFAVGNVADKPNHGGDNSLKIWCF